MKTRLVPAFIEKRCPRIATFARRFVLCAIALATILLPRTSFAWSRHRKEKMTIEEYRAMRNGTPTSFDLTDEIGPLWLGTQSFSLSGIDAAGHQRTVSLDGHALGVDRLVLDQFAVSYRLGIADHFSIGVPLSIGGGPVTEVTPPDLNDPTVPHVNGNAALILGLGISPGYEVNFGDSAIRFDAAVVGHAIFLPTNWETHDKHGRLTSASATAFQAAFEPRVTVLPYVRRDIGIGFFGEADAVHPENWACGLVIQARWGRAG